MNTLASKTCGIKISKNGSCSITVHELDQQAYETFSENISRGNHFWHLGLPRTFSVTSVAPAGQQWNFASIFTIPIHFSKWSRVLLRLECLLIIIIASFAQSSAENVLRSRRPWRRISWLSNTDISRWRSPSSLPCSGCDISRSISWPVSLPLQSIQYSLTAITGISAWTKMYLTGLEGGKWSVAYVSWEPTRQSQAKVTQLKHD